MKKAIAQGEGDDLRAPGVFHVSGERPEDLHRELTLSTAFEASSTQIAFAWLWLLSICGYAA